MLTLSSHMNPTSSQMWHPTPASCLGFRTRPRVTSSWQVTQNQGHPQIAQIAQIPFLDSSFSDSICFHVYYHRLRDTTHISFRAKWREFSKVLILILCCRNLRSYFSADIENDSDESSTVNIRIGSGQRFGSSDEKKVSIKVKPKQMHTSQIEELLEKLNEPHPRSDLPVIRPATNLPSSSAKDLPLIRSATNVPEKTSGNKLPEIRPATNIPGSLENSNARAIVKIGSFNVQDLMSRRILMNKWCTYLLRC